MLDTEIHSRATLLRLRTGPAANYIEGFEAWLRSRGYRPKTIKKTLTSLAAWTDWLKDSGQIEIDLPLGVKACQLALQLKTPDRYARGPKKESIAAANNLLMYLREQGVLPHIADDTPSSGLRLLLNEFRLWMREHRGVTDTTLDIYERILTQFLETYGTDTRSYNAEILRAFVLERAKQHGVSYAKLGGTTVRAFMRFLSATGASRVGLEHAIPAFASWKFSSVPKYLQPNDTAQLIAACTSDSVGLRNKVVLLLLSRLGLRAGDIGRIMLSDLDWKNGRLAVCGKGRRHEFLPLPQEIGDAIVDYLQRARPKCRNRYLVITACAPFGPLSAQGVSALVRRSLLDAGIQAPSYGAHVLRHTAATTMLREGASLSGIGAILRHRSPQTTTRYAKVDILALYKIAQPWPGV
jgi:site-specific recombinase XerD